VGANRPQAPLPEGASLSSGPSGDSSIDGSRFGSERKEWGGKDHATGSDYHSPAGKVLWVTAGCFAGMFLADRMIRMVACA